MGKRINKERTGLSVTGQPCCVLDRHLQGQNSVTPRVLCEEQNVS